MRMNSAGVNFVSYSYRFYHSMYVAIKTCMQVCQRSVVDYIEEDQIVSIASSTSLWHLDRINQLDLPLDGQFSSPSDGSGVDIYIFDTG